MAGTPNDLRSGAPLGGLNLDTAFTDLAGDDGRWVVRLELGDRWAELWAEAKFGWLQVYTGADRRDRSIAVEPMTCGPDAFNPGITHDDVIVLRPGDSFAGQWGDTWSMIEPERTDVTEFQHEFPTSPRDGRIGSAHDRTR